MRIRADFAKDLPERQADTPSGKLDILHAYAGDGLDQTRFVLDRANQALNEVPQEDVRIILRRVIDLTNQVAAKFEQARARNSFDAAWPIIAEAVSICRLDALPWATQAVRDAGVVGKLNVSVVDRAGNPIGGALVAVLTAHTPVSGRADGAGRASFVNVSAVSALQVKAFDDGIIYHEVNANISPGGTSQVTIALPGESPPSQQPQISNVSISPSSGPGNATVTFAMTATDPQGQLDLAEDQIYAHNPVLGLAYVLRRTSGSRYEKQVRLPDLEPGVHTWYFFAVDHPCNSSEWVIRRYTVE
jgi:hypothetical protein